MSVKYWTVTTKADQRPRMLADRHYSRQTPGHPMWTRPGYNLILYYEQTNGRAAAFCWWRPKWECGLPGVQRKDGLRAIECTLFRNETRVLSSKLIAEAEKALLSWDRYVSVDVPDGLITGVSSVATSGGRDPQSRPGECFYRAGWVLHPSKKAGKRADIWLWRPCP